VELEHLARPGALQDIDALIQAAPARLEFHVEGLVLLAHPAGSDTEHDPAGRERIGGRSRAGHRERMEERQDVHGRAEAQSPGRRGHGSDQRPHLGPLVLGIEERCAVWGEWKARFEPLGKELMLGEGDALETELLGMSRDLGTLIGLTERERLPEFHSIDSSGEPLDNCSSPSCSKRRARGSGSRSIAVD
jgi:hypothetical protein